MILVSNTNFPHCDKHRHYFNLLSTKRVRISDFNTISANESTKHSVNGVAKYMNKIQYNEA